MTAGGREFQVAQLNNCGGQKTLLKF